MAAQPIWDDEPHARDEQRERREAAPRRRAEANYGQRLDEQRAGGERRDELMTEFADAVSGMASLAWRQELSAQQVTMALRLVREAERALRVLAVESNTPG